jgi:hypothetical protein
MTLQYTSDVISTVTSGIRSPLTASPYMLFPFPENVITHTSVHQKVGEFAWMWSNLSIVEVQLHQTHLFWEDIDTYLRNCLELQSSCNRHTVNIPVQILF